MVHHSLPPITQLLLATGNQGKVREIKELFKGLDIKLFSAKDFSFAEPDENGLTFAENSEIKAKYYALHTDLPSLADDSGLVIPTLGGKPGVYSARWGGEEKDFNLAMQRVQHELYEQRGEEYEINDPAHFICALTIYWPKEDKILTVEGRVDGRLRFPPSGVDGFGYDPIFVPKGSEVSFAEMDLTEKQRISHRAKAFEQLLGLCFSFAAAG